MAKGPFTRNVNIFSSQLTVSLHKHYICVMKIPSYSWKFLRLKRYSNQLTSSLNKSYINFMKIPLYSWRNFYTNERAQTALQIDMKLPYFSIDGHFTGVRSHKSRSKGMILRRTRYRYLCQLEYDTSKGNGSALSFVVTIRWLEKRNNCQLHD